MYNVFIFLKRTLKLYTFLAPQNLDLSLWGFTDSLSALAQEISVSLIYSHEMSQLLLTWCIVYGVSLWVI